MDETQSVVVLLLPDLAVAEEAVRALREAVEAGRFQAEDWVIVTHDDGRMHLHHHRAGRRPATGFAGGALLGGVAGLFFGAVLAPAAIVGAGAAAITALTDKRVPKEALDQIGSSLSEGQAALFILADANSAAIIARETFESSTVAFFELDPDDAARVAEVADEVAHAVGGG